MVEDGPSDSNWSIIGHEWAVALLRRALANGRNRQAYLVTGSAGLGKMRLGLAFAKALVCEAADVAERPCHGCRACAAVGRRSHPDLILAGADAALKVDDVAERPCCGCRACAAVGRRSHPDLILAGGDVPLKVDEARNVMRLLALKPYSARYRIAILDDFHLVAPLAQDALLKTLEEPAPHAIVILLATAAERVLPTIRSRAQHIPLRPLSRQMVKARLLARGCDDERAELVAGLSGGRIGWALSTLEDEAPLAFRRDMLDLLRDVLGGPRLERLKHSEQLSRRSGREKALLRDALEVWQSYWRDVLLQCTGSPVKPCHVDRREEIRVLARRISAGQALGAMGATGRALGALDTNANLRLVLDALFLQYPGLDD